MTPTEVELATQLAKLFDYTTAPGVYLWSPATGRYQRYAGCGVWVDGDDGKVSTAVEPDAIPVLSDPATQGILYDQLSLEPLYRKALPWGETVARTMVMILTSQNSVKSPTPQRSA